MFNSITDENLKGILAVLILLAFVMIVLTWSLKGSILPPDLMGVVIGGLVLAIGGIVNEYVTRSKPGHDPPE